MTLRLLFASLGLCAAVVSAAPYEPINIAQIVVGPAVTIDTAQLHIAVQKLAPHATRYPVRFDNRSDMAQAHQDALQLSNALDEANQSALAASDILLLAGQWNTLAWRMSYPPAAARALQLLSRLVKREPNNLRARYLLGSFLMEFESGGDLAQPHLEAAHAGGLIEASYSLAMLSLLQNDTAAAKAMMENITARTGSDDPIFKNMLIKLSQRKVRPVHRPLPPLPDNALKLLSAAE